MSSRMQGLSNELRILPPTFQLSGTKGVSSSKCVSTDSVEHIRVFVPGTSRSTDKINEKDKSTMQVQRAKTPSKTHLMRTNAQINKAAKLPFWDISSNSG